MNKILNKIAQMERNAEEIKGVELAKHEVELANVKDISKALFDIRDIQEKLNKSEGSLKALQNTVDGQKEQLKTQVTKAESVITELTKQVSAIGLDINDVENYDRLVYEINSSKKNYLNK